MPFSVMKEIGYSFKIIIVFITLLFLLAFAPTLFSATYYVDATNGNDSRTGFSETMAWKTIAKVNRSGFKPGDQILFKRGDVWREQLTVPSSGSDGLPITFGAFGSSADALPVINGANLITHGSLWKNYTCSVWQSALTIEPKVVFFDGVLGQKKASIGAVASAGDWYWAANNLFVYSARDPDKAYMSPGVEVGQRDLWRAEESRSGGRQKTVTLSS
jgi:hypothetical protein